MKIVAETVISMLKAKLLGLDHELILTGSYALKLLGLLDHRDAKDLDFIIQVKNKEMAQVAYEKLAGRFPRKTDIDYMGNPCEIFHSTGVSGVKVDLWISYSRVNNRALEIGFNSECKIAHPHGIFNAKASTGEVGLDFKCTQDLNAIESALKRIKDRCK